MTLRQRLYENTGTYFFPPRAQIDTIFLGGGTPSLFSAEALSQVLTALNQHFDFTNTVEITLEANPGTVDLPKLKEFQAAGINRISLGVQSLQDAYLGAFGRIHTGTEALLALEAALLAGFERVNADLIFGFPGQTFKEWQNDVETILKLGCERAGRGNF
jgi:oxygen-independent coproporphyrinogen-3 oxidase